MVYSDDNTVTNDLKAVTIEYTNMLDDLFEQEAKTTHWTPNPALVQGFKGSATGKIPTLFTTGMGTYDAQKGYVIGQTKTEFKPYTLKNNRAVQHRLDGVDVMKSGGIATGSAVLANFARYNLIPELDATRIAAVATAVKTDLESHVSKAEAVSKSNILKKLREGLNMIEDETGIDSGCTILLNTKYKPALADAEGITITRDVNGTDRFNNKVANLDDNILKSVPSDRMWTSIDLSTDPVTDANPRGFKPTPTSAQEIVAMITAPDTAQAIVAHEVTRIFGPEEVQDFDGSKINYHVYHDCIVPYHRLPGCYVLVSEKTAPSARVAEAVQAAETGGSSSKKKSA